MSFNDKEISRQDGRPISLYEFRLDALFWRYTNADHDIVEGETYTAIPISDEGSTQGGSGGNSEEFTVNIVATADVCDLFVGPPPTEQLWLTVRRIHDGDGEPVVTWIGTVGSLRRKDSINNVISARSVGARSQRGGLRLTWERNCPHMLYGPGCNLNKDDWGFDTETINYGVPIDDDPSGTQTITFWIDIGELPVPELPGGFVEWDIGSGVKERRAIVEKLGPSKLIWVGGTYYTVSILGGNTGMSEALAIRVYPGCNRTIGALGCSDFSNTDNYGGYPHLPGTSPFDGKPIF